MVEQSLRKREVGGSSPSTGTSLQLLGKYALVLVSLAAYVGLSLLTEHLESTGAVPDPGSWLQLAAGAAFGVLVLGPYAAAACRLPRILALAAVSAAIYYGAIAFVANGPLSGDLIVSLVLVGSGAALLSGLAVVVIAPRKPAWRLMPLLLVAGAGGGAAFELKVANDGLLLVGHAAWQLLVCFALHYGFGRTPLTSSSAS